MSSTTPTSVDSLVEGFPNKLIPIRGMPTFDKLYALKQDLQRNAVSEPSSLGGGAHGYLGIVLDAASYGRAAGNDAAGAPITFTPPHFPGSRVVINAPNAPARLLQAQNFKDDSYEWRCYDNMVKALRKILVNAVDAIYLAPLHNKLTGYNNVTVEAILAHLFKEYGDIGPKELQVNEARLNEAWDGVEPWEIVMQRVEECIDYAGHAERPYTPAQILAKIELIVSECGLYHEDLREWDKKATAAKTYAAFNTHILSAHRANRKRNGTAKQQGYGLALQQLTTLAEGVANSVQQDHANHLAARAEQATIDASQREVIDRLTKQLAAVQQQNAAICKQNADIMAKLNLPAANFSTIPPATRQKRTPKDEGSYCHTHGYNVIKNHTSANCRWPKDGHQTAATRANPMGGSIVGKPV